MTDNFLIDTLGFQKHISPENPYERATAPFRKEQFDTAQTVGDQSLAGWWTRGQLSFHEGAGVKYYEVLDGAEILARYRSSLAVDPWEPGEVRLAKGFERTALAGVVDAVPADEGVAALLEGGTVQIASDVLGAAESAYTDEGVTRVEASSTDLFALTPSAIMRRGEKLERQFVPNPAFDASGGSAWWAPVGTATAPAFDGTGAITWSAPADGDGVEFTIPVAASPPRANLFRAPSAEGNIAGHHSTAGASSNKIERSATHSTVGSYSYQWTRETTTFQPRVFLACDEGTSISRPTAPGETYAMQVQIRGDAAKAPLSRDFRLCALVFDGSTNTVVEFAAGAVPNGGFVRLSGTVTMPAGATSVSFFIGAVGDVMPVGERYFFDAACLELDDVVLPYFDGDTALDGFTASWDGTPHESQSTLTESVGVSTGLLRVTTDQVRAVKVYDPNTSTWTDLGKTTAGGRFAAKVSLQTDTRIRVLSTATEAGSTRLSELSLTTALAESSTPNAADDARWVWTGTAHDSAQTRTVSASGFHVLWVPPTGRTWTGAWAAKRRLFAVDNAGDWYALPVEGGGGVAANPFWKSGHGSGWQLADSPSAVYVARGSDIQAITLEASGEVPTLTAPAIVAQLPLGEDIAGMVYYLGRLIVATPLGVRAAAVDVNGNLSYGPRFLDGDFSTASRMATYGNFVFLVGLGEDRDGDSAAYVVNMTTAQEPTLPAWAALGDVENTPFGCVVTRQGVLTLFDSLGLLRQSSTDAATGVLETGLHRLGTLEPKVFRELRVRLQGSGTVAVSVVLPDETTVSLGNVTAPASADLLIPASVGAVEHLGLRFEFTPGATESPVLLGYQLRALPVPRRQRLIRVPLKLYDSETHQGRATAGSAWERLAALEALEEASALVSFEDKETGESGSAYIEQVEVKRIAPAPQRGAQSGFGGVVNVTLRRVGDAPAA